MKAEFFCSFAERFPSEIVSTELFLFPDILRQTHYSLKKIIHKKKHRSKSGAT